MKFSIITPSFNQGPFLGETIDSVIGQTGSFRIEYFVMDGGSTDNTVEILKQTEKALKNNPRIKFYWQSRKDKGQVDAINQGLKKTTGDIVAYINSDDYYLPGAFSQIKEYFDLHPDKLWVAGDCKVTDRRLTWTFFLKHIWPVDKFGWALPVFNTINQPAVFLRSCLTEKTGVFNITYTYAFDYDYWLRCCRSGLPGRINTELAVFRIHPESKGNTGYIKQFGEDTEVVNKYTQNRLIKIVHKFGRLLVNLSYRYLK